MKSNLFRSRILLGSVLSVFFQAQIANARSSIMIGADIPASITKSVCDPGLIEKVIRGETHCCNKYSTGGLFCMTPEQWQRVVESCTATSPQTKYEHYYELRPSGRCAGLDCMLKDTTIQLWSATSEVSKHECDLQAGTYKHICGNLVRTTQTCASVSRPCHGIGCLENEVVPVLGEPTVERITNCSNTDHLPSQILPEEIDDRALPPKQYLEGTIALSPGEAALLYKDNLSNNSCTKNN